MNRFAWTGGVLLIAAATWGASPSSRPQEPDPAIARAIDALGSTDPQAREAAARQLREIGRRAIPALREAVKLPNPQVRRQAELALRALDRPPLPSSSGPGPHTFKALSHDEDSSTCEIVEGQRRIVVTQRNSDARHPNTDIVMTITGPVGGKPTEQVIKADDPIHLMWEAPEAWKIYHYYFEQDDHSSTRVVHDELEAAVKSSLREANLSPADRKRVGEQLKAFCDASDEFLRAVMYKPSLGPAKLAEEYRQSDALRRILNDLHVPPLGQGAETELEPPPQSRLGMYISLNPKELPLDYTSGLLVAFPAIGSRAEKIGIKPWDVIEQINGVAIESPGELRPAVEGCKSGMVIQVLRAGQRVKLEENSKSKPVDHDR